jgi:hypothetical protein
MDWKSVTGHVLHGKSSRVDHEHLTAMFEVERAARHGLRRLNNHGLPTQMAAVSQYTCSLGSIVANNQRLGAQYAGRGRGVVPPMLSREEVGIKLLQ